MSSSATYQAGVELLLVGGIVQDLDAMAGHEPPCARRRDDRGWGGPRRSGSGSRRQCTQLTNAGRRYAIS